MKVTLIIIDDFYVNPDDVRNFALQQEFNVTGNFPGARTKPFFNISVKETIERHMQFAGRKITDDSEYMGSFQITTSQNRTWIHSDPNNTWSAICYLTPDAPLSSGTGLFRHKASGQDERITQDWEPLDYTKYEMVDRIGNKYNRLIIYRGDLFHASLDYFGDNLQNGRLFQTFFFDTFWYN